jgi:hypothetical protein
MGDVVPAGDAVPPLGQLVEALSADRSSVSSLAKVLTGVLSDALPVGVVEVEYVRTMSDRLHGREGDPVALRVTLGDSVLIMRQQRGHVITEVATSVRGVILSRKEVTVTEWITELAVQIRRLAERNADARAALQRLLLG